MISLHSSYFKSICEGSFKEGVERRVDLQDDAPLAVWAMVDYFYTFEYEDLMDMHSGLGESRPHNSIQGHSQVFTAADKYDVPGLCELACNRFAAATLLDTLIPCSGSFYHKLAADLMAAIAHVYNHTPPDDHRLRDAAVSAWEAKGKSLLVHVNKADLQALFAEVPDFGVDVLARIANIPIGRYDDYHNIGNLDPTADAKDKDSNIEVFGWPSIDCLL